MDKGFKNPREPNARYVFIDHEFGNINGGIGQKRVEIPPTGEHVRYGDGMVIVEGRHERVIVPLARLFKLTIDGPLVSQLQREGNNHA